MIIHVNHDKYLILKAALKISMKQNIFSCLMVSYYSYSKLEHF
jgi:hypothetical protein